MRAGVLRTAAWRLRSRRGYSATRGGGALLSTVQPASSAQLQPAERAGQASPQQTARDGAQLRRACVRAIAAGDDDDAPRLPGGGRGRSYYWPVLQQRAPHSTLHAPSSHGGSAGRPARRPPQSAEISSGDRLTVSPRYPHSTGLAGPSTVMPGPSQSASGTRPHAIARYPLSVRLHVIHGARLEPPPHPPPANVWSDFCPPSG